MNTHRSLNVKKKTSKFTFTEMTNLFLHDNYITKYINWFSFQFNRRGNLLDKRKIDVSITRFPAKLHTCFCKSIKLICKD